MAAESSCSAGTIEHFLVWTEVHKSHEREGKPASLYVNSAPLFAAVYLYHSCLHWTNKPGKEGWCDLRIQLCSPLGIWEYAPKPLRNVGKARNDCISLLVRRLSLLHIHRSDTGRQLAQSRQSSGKPCDAGVGQPTPQQGDQSAYFRLPFHLPS